MRFLRLRKTGAAEIWLTAEAQLRCRASYPADLAWKMRIGYCRTNSPSKNI